MKKIVLAALAASTALIATQASAQAVTTGQVTVTGTVNSRCSVVLTPGGAASQSFSGTINLMQLDDPDGTLRDNLIGSATATPADGLHVTTRVVCNTAAPVVTIAATAMQISGGTLDGTTGYSDTIHYTGQVEVDRTNGTSEFRRVHTLTGPVAPGATGAMALPISAAPGDNVDVSVYGLSAEGANTNILAAGTYNGLVTVTINPV